MGLRQLTAAPPFPPTRRPAVDLYWIPLGAGAHVVRLSGRLFEKLSAFLQRRQAKDLYHSALRVVVPEGDFVIEMAPIPDGNGRQRGVVVEGPVGTRWAGRMRMFRYEIRRWSGGTIPDSDQAVPGPTRVTDDLDRARRILDLVPHVPAAVWGRDDLKTGDMWNSNSVTSWLLVRSGIGPMQIQLPDGGRAPGWTAGAVEAARDFAPSDVLAG
jgi:hypothetical protein